MSTKRDLLKVIRARCLECCSGDEGLVANCTAGPDSKFSKCSLWPYRLGNDIKVDNE